MFGTCAVLLHIAYWGHNPRYLSLYVFRHYGFLWTLALMGLGIGSLALAMGLDDLLPRRRSARIGLMATASSAVFVLLMVVFPTDRIFVSDYPTTPGGWIHDSAAVCAVLVQALAMTFLVAAGRRDPAWKRIAGSSYAWPTTYVLVTAVWMFSDAALHVSAAAPLQRVVAGIGWVWMLLLAARAITTLTPHQHPRAALQPIPSTYAGLPG